MRARVCVCVLSRNLTPQHLFHKSNFIWANHYIPQNPNQKPLDKQASIQQMEHKLVIWIQTQIRTQAQIRLSIRIRTRTRLVIKIRLKDQTQTQTETEKTQKPTSCRSLSCLHMKTSQKRIYRLRLRLRANNWL